MVYDRAMITCPHCGRSEGQVKSGRNRTTSQRYLCKACQRIYTPKPSHHGYSVQLRQQALRLYLDGNNFRRIGRLLGVHHQSVVNWVNAAQQQLTPYIPQRVAVETIEMDELFSFVGTKKTKSISSRQ